jgi:hypothetical protein
MRNLIRKQNCFILLLFLIFVQTFLFAQYTFLTEFLEQQAARFNNVNESKKRNKIIKPHPRIKVNTRIY